VTQGGRTRWDSAAVEPGSAGMGWERELTGGTHALVRGEREGAEDGRRESKKKTYSVKYAKGTRGLSEPMRGMMACEQGGPARRPGLAGLISIGKIQRVLIFEFKLISEFGKTLRISTRRFRRNLDTLIFPKFF
jgi:hypothetical protein